MFQDTLRMWKDLPVRARRRAVFIVTSSMEPFWVRVLPVLVWTPKHGSSSKLFFCLYWFILLPPPPPPFYFCLSCKALKMFTKIMFKLFPQRTVGLCTVYCLMVIVNKCRQLLTNVCVFSVTSHKSREFYYCSGKRWWWCGDVLLQRFKFDSSPLLNKLNRFFFFPANQNMQ